jgi:putative membrane protein
MKQIRLVISAIVLLTAVATGCAPNGDKSSTDTDNARGEGAVDSTKLAHFDTTHSTSSVSNFITSSIKANVGEIQLAQLAQDKATSPELKKLAAMMIQQHTQMLNELKGMAPSKQATIDSSANDVTKAALQNLSSAQGKDFDAKWTEQMLQLHENAAEEFKTMQTTTTDTTVKQWLTKTLPIIEQHRDMLAKKQPTQTNLQKGQTRD